MEEEVLGYLCEAIQNIPEHYYTLSNPQGYSKIERHPERLFTYELYHQLRIIIEKEKKNNSFYDEFFVDAEIYKRIERATYSKEDVTEKKYKETKSELDNDKVFPDLVIHTNQKSRKTNGQFLILECKTQTENLNQDAFNNDFFKLNEYISLLNFQFSVYLIINKSENDIRNYLNTYKKSYWTSKLGNVIFIVKENYKSKLKIFDTMLKEIKVAFESR